MDLPTGVWGLLAAFVTAAVALWQFSGLRDSRQATELLDLDRLVAVATARKDRLEHAYRAHLLQRMTAIHGNRRGALALGILWLLLSLWFAAALGSSNGPSLWVPLAWLAAMIASVSLAARALGRYQRAKNTKDIEALGALERLLIEERMQIARLASDLPALEPPARPDLKNWWSSLPPAQRRSYRFNAVFLGFVGLCGLAGASLLREGVILPSRAIQWTAIQAAVAVALSMTILLPLWRFKAWFQSLWLARTLFWFSHGLWSIISIGYGAQILKQSVHGLQAADPMSASELGLFLGVLVAVATIIIALPIYIWLAERKERAVIDSA